MVSTPVQRQRSGTVHSLTPECSTSRNLQPEEEGRTDDGRILVGGEIGARGYLVALFGCTAARSYRQIPSDNYDLQNTSNNNNAQ